MTNYICILSHRTLRFGNKYYIATTSAQKDAEIAAAAETGVKGGRPAAMLKSKSIGSHLMAVNNVASQLVAGRAVISAMIEIGEWLCVIVVFCA